jgi:hypothetical protein
VLYGPQHFQVRDVVLKVGFARGHKAQFEVEPFQVRLGTDTYRQVRKVKAASFDGTAHELLAQPQAASSPRDYDAADTGLGVYTARNNDTRISHHSGPISRALPTNNMQGAGILAIDILVGTILLNHENFSSQSEYGI